MSLVEVSLGSLCFCSLVLTRMNTGSSAKQTVRPREKEQWTPTSLWELLGQRRAVSHTAEPCSSRDRAMCTAVRKNHPAPISCCFLHLYFNLPGSLPFPAIPYLTFSPPFSSLYRFPLRAHFTSSYIISFCVRKDCF